MSEAKLTVACPVCDEEADPSEIELWEPEVPVYKRSTGFSGNVTGLTEQLTRIATFPCKHNIKTV